MVCFILALMRGIGVPLPTTACEIVGGTPQDAPIARLKMLLRHAYIRPLRLRHSEIHVGMLRLDVQSVIFRRTLTGIKTETGKRGIGDKPLDGSMALELGPY
jgi:hypothetical protein